ncbi:MAG: cyanophycinase [Pirellula sp.]
MAAQDLQAPARTRSADSSSVPSTVVSVLASDTVHNTDYDQTPWRGSILLCGGSTLPRPILDTFFRLGRGSAGKLVIIPTASPRSDLGDFLFWTDYWKDYAWQSIDVVHASSREQLLTDSTLVDQWVESLRNADAVWIAGGDQSRLSERYLGTPVDSELVRLLERGGVLGGTSAGAAICSQRMISGGTVHPEFKAGFGLLPGVIIDQHFLAKNRQERLHRAVSDHQGLNGLGLDESTALWIHGAKARVIGSGKVHWYGGDRGAGGGRAQATSSGQQKSFAADEEWSDGIEIPLAFLKLFHR